MTRDDFLAALRTADDVWDDEPFTPYVQRIADYDADRRVLIKEQRAEIERLQAQLATATGALRLLATGECGSFLRTRFPFSLKEAEKALQKEHP